jgi:DNA-3-methyladenine glycosylase I
MHESTGVIAMAKPHEQEWQRQYGHEHQPSVGQVQPPHIIFRNVPGAPWRQLAFDPLRRFLLCGQRSHALTAAMPAKQKEIHRCGWVLPRNPDNEPDADYVHYHDTEWGVPVHDDKVLFEFLILEGMQAGLSWMTILKKRENFRRAFDGFDAEKIARYRPAKIEKLMLDAGIIRNRLKIEAAVRNARGFIEIQKEFGSFASYIWNFVGGKPIVNKFKTYRNAPARTELSDNISQDLKKRGFNFVGSTIVYAHMQATGMVNDHEVGCFRYRQV